MLDEVLEVLRRRSPPLVDGLVLVPYRDHREAVAEDGGDEDSLGRVGVLVLVENQHPIAVPDHPG